MARVASRDLSFVVASFAQFPLQPPLRATLTPAPQPFLAMLSVLFLCEKRNDRTRKTRTRPRPPRSHLPQHDVHDRHRPFRSDSLHDPRHEWPAMHSRLGHRRRFGARGRLRLGRTRRRDAASRRQLRFSARSLRTKSFRPPNVVPIHLANALSRSAQYFLGRAWIRGLFALPHRKNGGSKRLARRTPPAIHVRARKLQSPRRNPPHRNRRGAPLPPHYRHRQNLHNSLDHRRRHNRLAHLWRRNSLQQRPRLHPSPPHHEP